MKKIIISLILLSCFSTSIVNAWDKEQITKEVAFQLFNAGEKILTYDLINDKNLELQEANSWIYGKNPSKEKLALAGLVTGILHLWATDYLIKNEPEMVNGFQNMTLIVYGSVFAWNLHFKF